MHFFYPNGRTPADMMFAFRMHLKRLSGPIYRIMVTVDPEAAPEPEDLVALPEELSAEIEAAEKKLGQEVGGREQATEGRVVGVSMWQFHPNARTEEEMAAEAAKSPREFPPSADQKFMTAFFKALGDARKRIIGGKRHIYLHILATDPAYHRKGVGAQSLAWGAREADERELILFLEASAMGRPLYARSGYEEMGLADFDARSAGAHRDVPQYLMLRPAKVKGS